MTGGTHDAVVVGAGPAGSSAAVALAARGLCVLLLDKAQFPREKTCGDGLTPRAVAALREMGVFDRLRYAAEPIARVDVVAPDGAAVTAAVPAPGMAVVPRVHLDDAIRRRAVEAGASFDGGVRVDGIVRGDGGVTLRAARGGRPATYRARMAIVATGASLVLPRGLGAVPRLPAMMLAARTYVARHAPRVEIRFAGVPLPGYGWIFPVTASSANAGVGFAARRRHARGASSAREACERFLETVEAPDRLDRSRPVEAIRSYPLRVDFPASAVWADGVLFAGEAAGLVNPLTGEGIDYALESGRIAADHAAAFLMNGDRSPGAFAAAGAAYERTLRRRFERLFAVCRVLRDVSGRPAVLNRLVRAASHRDDFRMALVNVVLGHREPFGPGSVRAALARLTLAR